MKISEDAKNLLSPFFPNLNLEEVVLIDGSIIGRMIMTLFGASAITFGDKIYFAERLDQSNFFNMALIGHELVHVEQYKKLGMVRFLIRYLLEFVVNLRKERTCRKAYMAIPFEREAYQTEEMILDLLISSELPRPEQ